MPRKTGAGASTATKKKFRVDTKWFDEQLKRAGVSGRELSFRIDTNQSTLWRMFNGERRMRGEDAEKIAAALDVDVTEVYQRGGVIGEPPVPAKLSVPLAGTLSGDGSIKIREDYEKARKVRAPVSMSQSTIAIQARTADSVRHHLDGFIFYFAAPHEIEDDVTNRMSIIGLDNGKVVLGYVRPGYHVNTYNISDPWGRGRENAKIDWASRIQWIKT